MSFSCPHFNMKNDTCLRLDRRCVPGRPGCVLRVNSVFVVPVEERLEAEKNRDRVPPYSRAEHTGG